MAVLKTPGGSPIMRLYLLAVDVFFLSPVVLGACSGDGRAAQSPASTDAQGTQGAW